MEIAPLPLSPVAPPEGEEVEEMLLPEEGVLHLPEGLPLPVRVVESSLPPLPPFFVPGGEPSAPADTKLFTKIEARPSFLSQRPGKEADAEKKEIVGMAPPVDSSKGEKRGEYRPSFFTPPMPVRPEGRVSHASLPSSPALHKERGGEAPHVPAGRPLAREERPPSSLVSRSPLPSLGRESPRESLPLQRVPEQQPRPKQEKQEPREGGGSSQQEAQDQEGGDREEGGVGEVRAVERGLLEDFFTSVAEEDTDLLVALRALRVTHLDVILLFLEVLKLFLRSQEEERIARMEERRAQLAHMEHVVGDFKSQGKYQIIAGTLSGVLSIASGVLPIVGYVGGATILDKLKNVPLLNKLSGMPPLKLFKQLEKMTSALAESQKNMGQIQTTFLEGSRFLHQHKGEMRKTDADEDTRTMEELKESWRNLDNLILRFLQMDQDTAHQILSAR